MGGPAFRSLLLDFNFTVVFFGEAAASCRGHRNYLFLFYFHNAFFSFIRLLLLSLRTQGCRLLRHSWGFRSSSLIARHLYWVKCCPEIRLFLLLMLHMVCESTQPSSIFSVASRRWWRGTATLGFNILLLTFGLYSVSSVVGIGVENDVLTLGSSLRLYLSLLGTLFYDIRIGLRSNLKSRMVGSINLIADISPFGSLAYLGTRDGWSQVTIHQQSIYFNLTPELFKLV